MIFDTSGMNRAFDRIKKSAEKRGRDLGQDQGNFFLRMTKKLGWQLAPSKDMLNGLLSSLGGRLKRKPGVSPVQEIARRKRARGTFARRWYISKIEMRPSVIRIWISNTVTYADLPRLAVVVKKSAEIVGGRFQKRLVGMAKKIMGDF